MKPEEAKAQLASLAPFGMRFGLERMEAVLAALDHPERLPRVFHVAGTNGKGSTCAFAESMLRAAGLRVGLYTSPHLERVNERIRIDGEPISDEEFAACMDEILRRHPEATRADAPLTYFEMVTALALLAFARAGVDAVVLETGLGGRLDATNAVPSQVAAISRIAVDHAGILGSTLEEIAAEKAGIFKPGATVLLGRNPDEARRVLQSRAEAITGGVQIAGRDFRIEPSSGALTFISGGVRLDELSLGLLGSHQWENAELAIASVRALLPEISEAAIRRGLAATRWPGRLERVRSDPEVILDGAHNPDAAAALARAMSELFPDRPVHLVFGALEDKDVEGIANLLLQVCETVDVCAPSNERALSLASLTSLARARHDDVQAHPALPDALTSARMKADRSGGILLVAGSLFLVGEARSLLAG